MEQNTSHSTNLRWVWTAEFHGPNPCANSAVIVGELTADLMPTVEQLKRARKQLWDVSGLTDPLLENESPLYNNGLGEDALLELGLTASTWAQAALNEVRGFIEHAGAQRYANKVRLWVGFHHAQLSRAALQMALSALTELINGRFNPSKVKTELHKLWQACGRHHPDFQARILMVAARDMDVPFMPFLMETRNWQFGWGARSHVFFETASNGDGALGWQWQRNKVTSKNLMRSLGLPTPNHVLIHTEDDLSEAFKRVGVPCVVKPLDGGSGKGVTANIRDEQGLHLAFQEARRYSNGPLMIEQHIQGMDYRLMVVSGKLVAAIQREASFLIGDGRATVEELLRRLNSTRFMNLPRSRYLRPVAVDDLLHHHFAAQGVDLTTVLPLGKRVTLRSNANRSTGGICQDVTDRLHPQVRTMAEQLARVMGLRAVGIDYLTLDIGQTPWSSGGGFIEINATPGMAVFVAAGWTESAIGRVLLGEAVGRINVTLTIVSRENQPQLLESLQKRELGENNGWVCGHQLRIGAASFFIHTKQAWGSVGAALRNPCLHELEVYCTGEDIARDGLPADRFVAVKILDRTLEEDWKQVLADACDGVLTA